MAKIQEYKTKTGPVNYIIIPKAIMEFKGWGKGTELTFVQHNGDVILKEK